MFVSLKFDSLELEVFPVFDMEGKSIVESIGLEPFINLNASSSSFKLRSNDSFNLGVGALSIIILKSLYISLYFD